MRYKIITEIVFGTMLILSMLQTYSVLAIAGLPYVILASGLSLFAILNLRSIVLRHFWFKIIMDKRLENIYTDPSQVVSDLMQGKIICAEFTDYTRPFWGRVYLNQNTILCLESIDKRISHSFSIDPTEDIQKNLKMFIDSGIDVGTTFLKEEFLTHVE